MGLVIVFAYGVHTFVEQYLRHWFSTHDLTTERQLLMRLAYPLVVLFVVWNLKAFK
jgi:hypothetical protein